MKYPLSNMILIVPVIWFAVSCTRDLTPQELMDKAQEHITKGNYSAARIELSNAARKAPSNADIRYELANVALNLGDSLAAEKEARRALEYGIQPESTILLLVQAIYMQGEFERVLAESEQLPEALDSNVAADILAYRANALLRLQRYRLADAVVEEALRLNEDSVLALLAKSSYEAEVGSKEAALSLAKRALEVDSKSAEAWAVTGSLYASIGDLAQAREAYNSAVLNGQYVSLYWAKRAYMSSQLGDFTAAELDLKQLSDSGLAAHPYVNFVRGYTAFRQANYVLATEAFQLSVNDNPDDAIAKLYLAASFLNDGKLEQARMVANQLFVAIPQSIEVARMLASIDIQDRDFDSAKASLIKILETDEEDTTALGMLGTISLMQGDGDLAVDYYERLATLVPNNIAIQKMLELAISMRGDFVSELSSNALRSVSAEEYHRVLATAVTALKQRRLKESLVITENLLQQYPDRVGVLNMMAAIYLYAGDWQRGKGFLEQVLKIDPVEPSAVNNLAGIYLKTGDELTALRLLSSYLEMHPQDQTAVGLLSEAIVATSDYTFSELKLRDLLESHPDNLEVRGRLVQLYFDNAKYEQVLIQTSNLSNEAIRLQPSLMELRGKALFNLGDSAGAQAVWEKWVHLAPLSVLANFYYAESLVDDDQLDLALEHLEKALLRKPGYIPARILSIRLKALSGDPGSAYGDLEILRSELPEDRSDLWYIQGWLDVSTGNYEGAEHALNKSLALQPTAEAAILLFTTLNTLGRQHEGLTALERWQKKLPNNPSLVTILGQSYLADGQQEKAVDAYISLLEANPESILALNNLAWLFQERDTPIALEYAQRAVNLAPNDPVVLSTLGTVLYKSGRSQEGERALRRAIDIRPEDMQFKLRLGHLLLTAGRQAEAQILLQDVIDRSSISTQVSEATKMMATFRKDD